MATTAHAAEQARRPGWGCDQRVKCVCGSVDLVVVAPVREHRQFVEKFVVPRRAHERDVSSLDLSGQRLGSELFVSASAYTSDRHAVALKVSPNIIRHDTTCSGVFRDRNSNISAIAIRDASDEFAKL